MTRIRQAAAAAAFLMFGTIEAFSESFAARFLRIGIAALGGAFLGIGMIYATRRVRGDAPLVSLGAGVCRLKRLSAADKWIISIGFVIYSILFSLNFSATHDLPRFVFAISGSAVLGAAMLYAFRPEGPG